MTIPYNIPNKINNKSRYSPGNWFIMKLGFEFNKFYIAETLGDMCRISRKGWLASMGLWLSINELENQFYKAKYVGYGKRKWYWRWLPWRDIVVPFYEPIRQKGISNDNNIR